MMKPEFYTFEDDGVIPNSPLPVVIYRQVIPLDEKDFASFLETTFQKNGWTNNWRDIVLPYDHFHSNTHEVLGVSRGTVSLQVGGAAGKTVALTAGDVAVMPAGVGHRDISHHTHYEIVGGYPNGRQWDMMTGTQDERPIAQKNIASLPTPQTDPIFGTNGPLIKAWNHNNQD